MCNQFTHVGIISELFSLPKDGANVNHENNIFILNQMGFQKNNRWSMTLIPFSCIPICEACTTRVSVMTVDGVRQFPPPSLFSERHPHPQHGRVTDVSWRTGATVLRNKASQAPKEPCREILPIIFLKFPKPVQLSECNHMPNSAKVLLW